MEILGTILFIIVGILVLFGLSYLAGEENAKCGIPRTQRRVGKGVKLQQARHRLMIQQEKCSKPMSNKPMSISIDVESILKKAVADECNLTEEETNKLFEDIYSSHSNDGKEMIYTQPIKDLLSNFASTSRPDNALFRKDYETKMYSRDYSTFIKERIRTKDIESVWQFLCLSKGYEYDSSSYPQYGFAETVILKRIKTLLHISPQNLRPSQIITIYNEKQPEDIYQKIESIVNNQFTDVEKELFKVIIQDIPINKRDVLEKIIRIDFNKIISATEECWLDFLSAFTLQTSIDYLSIERGRMFLTTAIAELLSYALSIYDFKIICILPLIERANYLIKHEAEQTDYFKNIPLFSMDNFPTEYNTPLVSKELRDKLKSMGANERYYFLYDCFPRENISSSYQTKVYGIDEEKVNDMLIDNELLVPNRDISCLLSQTKETLISIATRYDILVRKSWTKEKIYTTIAEKGNQKGILYEYIEGMKKYKINPAYRDDIMSLIEYHSQIKPLMYLLGFIQ